MRKAEATEKLFDQVIRLRRAERAHSSDRDIASARAYLEQQIGPTVSGRQAASILGVSHTALARWVRAGDLATVMRPDGREGIALGALIDLYETVASDGPIRRGHPLEPAMAKGRNSAARMDTAALISDLPQTTDDHDRAGRRSLAYHRAVARTLRRRTADEALHRIWQWREQGHIDPDYAMRWEQLLSRPLSEIRRAIGEDSEEARDLRQNSPFAGTLSEPERNKLMREIR